MATFSQNSFTPRYAEGDNAASARLVGFELEDRRKEEYRNLRMDRYSESKNEIEQAVVDCPGIVNWGHDGGDKEFVTNPMSETIIRAGGNDELKSVFTFLTKYFESDKRSGTHLNVSKLKSDSRRTYRNLWWFEVFFFEQATKIFGRNSHWAQPPQNLSAPQGAHSKRFYEILGEKQSRGFSKANAKSVFIVDKGNRFEFRGAKATVELKEALAWAEFCLNIVNAAAKNETNRTPFAGYLKGEHIEDYAKTFCIDVPRDNPRHLSTYDLYHMPTETTVVFSTDRYEDKIY